MYLCVDLFSGAIIGPCFLLTRPMRSWLQVLHACVMYLFMYIYIYIFIYVYIYIYIYLCLYIYIYTCIHTYIHILWFGLFWIGGLESWRSSMARRMRTPPPSSSEGTGPSLAVTGLSMEDVHWPAMSQPLRNLGAEIVLRCQMQGVPKMGLLHVTPNIFQVIRPF